MSAVAPICSLCRRQATSEHFIDDRGRHHTLWNCRPCREYVRANGDVVVPAHFGATLFDAAAAYMLCGWYVLPIRRGKHAGSVVGKKWPEKSTRELWLLRKWLRPSMVDHCGLALHVGRSGAVAYDVDNPVNLPQVLRDAIQRHRPPFQSTRPDDPDRGHYLWRLPQGVMLGNGLGQLRTDAPWGELRGRNGIIVVAPSVHAKPEGHYEWRRGGRLPELPKELARAALRPAATHADGGHVYHPMYSTRRVDALLTRLRNAHEGERNNLLFWTACRFGELIAEDRIDAEMIRETLIDIGIELDLSSSEATATTDSGLYTGSWAWSV